MTWHPAQERVDRMISSHAHISMTYQPPVPEPKHVHRVERKQREPRPERSTRRHAVAEFFRLVPRQA
jgi:hypothetical protein